MTGHWQDELVATRRSLHTVVEQVMAGPQYRRSGTIRLRVHDAGIETVAQPALRLHGDTVTFGDVVAPLGGRTIADLAEELGLDAGAPEGLYPDSAGLGSDEKLVVDVGSSRRLVAAYEVGRDAMQAFHPAETPVLWPEHFDLGIQWDEVNYGLSGGDSFHETPYAYVGPWTPREGGFWNASFGAVLPVDDDTRAEAVADFFRRGRELARN